MIIVFESLIPVFILIGMGLFFRKFEIVPENQWEGINTLGYYVFFPALISHILITSDLNAAPLSSLTLVFVYSSLAQSAIVLLQWPLLKSQFQVSRSAFTSVFQTSTRWNGFIALAIAAKLYGDTGIAIVAIGMAVIIPLVNILCVVVLSYFCGDGRFNVGRVLKNTLLNPLIISSLLGVSINLLEIPIYDPVLATLDIVGRPGLGVGLLLVGAGLKLRYIFPPRLVVLLAVCLRLLVMPMVVFITCLIVGVKGEMMLIAIICGSVPTAMNGYFLARKLGGDAPLYSAVATIQTFISILTIPLVLWVAEQLPNKI